MLKCPSNRERDLEIFCDILEKFMVLLDGLTFDENRQTLMFNVKWRETGGLLQFPS